MDRQAQDQSASVPWDIPVRFVSACVSCSLMSFPSLFFSSLLLLFSALIFFFVQTLDSEAKISHETWNYCLVIHTGQSVLLSPITLGLFCCH